MHAPNSPTLKSWVRVPHDSDFPIQNLPFGIFLPADGSEPRVGVAIGEDILDLALLDQYGFFNFHALPAFRHDVFNQPTLNAFMAEGPQAWTAVRNRVSELLSTGCKELSCHDTLKTRALHRQADCRLLLPVTVGDYTDFYSSLHHATNVGKMLRPDNPLMPNWKHMPIGYHGRASSIIVSGTPFRRPCGQAKPDDAQAPSFGPCKRLDYELEVAFLVGRGNDLGTRIPCADARRHIFGLVLMNDWSARDLQKWEYQPLGPFLSKSFATTISPWVVMLDALEPFFVPRPPQDPPVLPYLHEEGRTALDLNLEASLTSADGDTVRICRTNFRDMYWTMSQQLAHQTVAGVNTRTGDLYGSGTVSGPTPDSLGCLLEATAGGTKPIALPRGGKRAFIEDGDTITIRGWCQGDGYRVGFGEARGTVLPAIT